MPQKNIPNTLIFNILRKNPTEVRAVVDNAKGVLFKNEEKSERKLQKHKKDPGDLFYRDADEQMLTRHARSTRGAPQNLLVRKK